MTICGAVAACNARATTCARAIAAHALCMLGVLEFGSRPMVPQRATLLSGNKRRMDAQRRP
eukprot:9832878-Lingulodinium_polyedra.AAC.1